MNGPIDEVAQAAIVRTLELRLSTLGDARLSSEIQDGGEYILLCVDVARTAESWSSQVQQDFLKAASHDLQRQLPDRNEDYRWMIVIRLHGTVVDSVMGGWSGKPIV